MTVASIWARAGRAALVALLPICLMAAPARAQIDAEGYRDPAFTLPKSSDWTYRGEADRAVTLLCQAAVCAPLPENERDICSVAVEQSADLNWTNDLLRQAVGRQVFEEAGAAYGSGAEINVDGDPQAVERGTTLWIEGTYSGKLVESGKPLRGGLWITGRGPITVSLACFFDGTNWPLLETQIRPVLEGFRWDEQK